MSLTSKFYQVNDDFPLLDHGSSKLDAIFQMVMPPIMIPKTPTPIARIKKFFFSANFSTALTRTICIND